MNLMTLLDSLQDEIETARNVPLMNKCAIDQSKCLEYLEQIRDALPEELLEADQIRKESKQILDEAYRKAEEARLLAERKAERLLDEHVLVQQAKIHAEEIIAKAQDKAQQYREGAMNYAEEIMTRLENMSLKCIDELQRNRQEIQQTKDRGKI